MTESPLAVLESSSDDGREADDLRFLLLLLLVVGATLGENSSPEDVETTVASQSRGTPKRSPSNTEDGSMRSDISMVKEAPPDCLGDDSGDERPEFVRAFMKLLLKLKERGEGDEVGDADMVDEISSRR